jgi:hypothetical protein
MSEYELEKLLGGFAADTLTPDERQKLFTAALQDQQLFTALADEQALKELLADPDVRRKLLQALNQTSSAHTSDPLFWLNWLRRPATLAYAGGLAAAAFAIVLGTKMYEESLRQAVQSVATEDTTPVVPASPPASQPAQAPITDAEQKTNVASDVESTKNKGLSDTMAKREKAAASKDERRRRSEQDEARRQAEAPLAAHSTSAENATTSASQEANVPPAAAAPELKQMQANTSAVNADPSAVSARALFYAQTAARSDVGTMAEQGARKPSAEPATPEANRPEQRMDRFALTSKAAEKSAQVKPLGLRYSVVAREVDGQDREVDPTHAEKYSGPVYLTVETNQDAYVQVWKSAGASTPQLLFPDQETGQISLRMTAGQRQRIPLPTGSHTITLRLSRAPFGPISRQEAVMLGRRSAGQIQETTTTGPPTETQEQATYIVNQDRSPTAQITAEIPFVR